MTGAALVLATKNDETGAVPQGPLQAGDEIGSKYRVERVIGQGGMGQVLAARHLDLDQLVAVKVLLPDAAAEEGVVERFLREGRASVRLKGQHVTKVLDVGQHHGTPYLVMEYLEGQSLRDVLDAYPQGMPVHEAVQLLLQACEGIAEAHALGIVHRDIKPENLFVSVGADGRPLLKVLDFGISKVQGLGEQPLTQTASLFGSPQYMSPEQMRSTKHVDARTDVWSLGVVAYELLCGKRPFNANTVYELCLQVAQDEPVPLGVQRPELPAALTAAIAGCLRKDQAARTSNVAALARALEPFGGERARGSGERVEEIVRRSPSLLPPSPDASGEASAWGATERLPRMGARRPLWILAAAALIVAGLLLYGVTRPVSVVPEPGAATPPLEPESSAALRESALGTPTLAPPSSTEEPLVSPPVSSSVETRSDPSPESHKGARRGGGKTPVAEVPTPTPAPEPAPVPEPAPAPAPSPAPKPTTHSEFENSR